MVAHTVRHAGLTAQRNPNQPEADWHDLSIGLTLTLVPLLSLCLSAAAASAMRLQLMGRHFESKQYAARPPLVTFSHLPSTLTHYMEPASDSYWEAKWIKYGNLGLI